MSANPCQSSTFHVFAERIRIAVKEQFPPGPVATDTANRNKATAHVGNARNIQPPLHA